MGNIAPIGKSTGGSSPAFGKQQTCSTLDYLHNMNSEFILVEIYPHE